MENDEDEEIWVKHYSSNQRILLVGEGDFSFSACLALYFGSASNITATSLDTYDIVVGKYKKAKWNLEMLFKLGAWILHGVDATKMKLYSDLKMQKFDRIIFNFPHAGFHGREKDIHQIGRHKKLVLGFFTSASGMLRAEGEIHVTHKTSYPFSRWNIEELAWKNSLRLIECADFKIEDYPGYNNKRGDSRMRRCDKPFPLGECSTFKFRFSPSIKKMSRVTMQVDNTRKRSELSNSYSFETNYQASRFDHGHPKRCLSNNMDVVVQKALPVRNVYHWNQTSEIYQTPIGMNLHGRPRFDYERSMGEAVGRWQHYQANQRGDQYERDPFGAWDVQREFKMHMNNFSGYMGAPLSDRMGRGSLNASDRYVSDGCKQRAMIYGQSSKGTHMCEYQRSVESGSRRLHEVNLLYENAGKAFGFQRYD
ncbi:heavy metal-associated isoprenylated plant protein 41-like [Euphorbia lathyris]|uniref:heavy metal-associated isoprenylated plant protein 41-like n=1 Tax=Euphorbia lathyris TaxID=212925 RepID=UPI0033143656